MLADRRQNVNNVASAVQLRLDAEHSAGLDKGTRARLRRIAGLKRLRQVVDHGAE